VANLGADRIEVVFDGESHATKEYSSFSLFVGLCVSNLVGSTAFDGSESKVLGQIKQEAGLVSTAA